MSSRAQKAAAATGPLVKRPRPDIESVLGVGKSAPASGMAKWRRWIVAALLAAGGLAAWAVWGTQNAGDSIRFVTEPAQKGDLTVIVTATGSVQPINEVDVSSELSGTVRRVLVDYNSKVKAGEPLAELDTDKLKATVDSSRAKVGAANAKVKDAEATLNEKKLDFERKEQLARRKVTSDVDLEAARASYYRAIAAVESARADLVAAEADLKLNETNLSKACICSPINGIVLSRNVEPGQTVASNLQAPVLFTLAEDLSKMQVQVDVDEADVGQVQEGQAATFTVDAYAGKIFTGHISELRYGSETVQGVVTYKAVLTTDNSDLLLRPGMTATAEIKVKEIKDAITIPNAALRYLPPAAEPEDNRSFIRRILPGPPALRKATPQETNNAERTIWILSSGRSKEIEVTIGASDGRRTEIVKGAVAPGDAVIIDSSANGS